MFEDSTFESNGRIRTRSRGWMIVTFALNSAILLTMILVPLIYTQALPRQAMAFLMEVPPPPPATPPPTPRAALRPTPSPAAAQDPFAAPRLIPPHIFIPSTPEPAAISNIATLDPGPSVPGGTGDPFGHQPAPHVVPQPPAGPLHVPSTLAAGMLVHKVIPQYPQLAVTMRAQGTVVLAATIAKDGTIANLRVVSGPPILQQAALDAVSQWRYRPYLLNGQAVDVETTVNVIFTLGH